MRSRISALLILVCVTTAFCAYGWAQETQAKIPFAFKIGEKKLPAGNYLFQIDAANPGKVKVVSQSGKPVAEAIVQTRLAQISGTLNEPHLVFDKTDEDQYLAELWLPGEDGYFLGGTGHTHTHVVIHGSATH